MIQFFKNIVTQIGTIMAFGKSLALLQRQLVCFGKTIEIIDINGFSKTVTIFEEMSEDIFSLCIPSKSNIIVGKIMSPYRNFVLAHELAHCILLHCVEENIKRFQISNDPKKEFEADAFAIELLKRDGLERKEILFQTKKFFEETLKRFPLSSKITKERKRRVMEEIDRIFN